MSAATSQRDRLAELIAQGDFEAEDLQELRIAMVMTGGVSLAIWMGGATREFDRVIRADDKGSDTYLELLRLTRSLPRVDVIAGTSAGGLNGALFAYAITQGTDVAGLGPLWGEVGALEELLRQPGQTDAPSLMRGDDYFLPKISDAIKALDGPGTSPQEVPMELVITTTLLTPWPRGVSDTFGTIIHDADHRGEFSFRRGINLDLRDPAPADDTFDAPDIRARLALAARCTASFPLAFEASYVPIGQADSSAERPDMSGPANFGTSRFAIDGGLLVNRPLRPALRAIFRQPARMQVRRVLAYVMPDPGEGAGLEGDERTAVPTLADVGTASAVRIPGNQSVNAELNELTEHNARVDAQRRRRELVVMKLDVDALAASSYKHYRGFRADVIARWLLGFLARGFTALELSKDPADRAVYTEAPLRERTQLRERLLEHLENLPPGEWPTDDSQPTEWFTTIDTVERAAGVVLDLLRRGLAATDPRSRDRAEQRRELRRLRGEICAELATAQATRQPLTQADELRLARGAVLALRQDASPPAGAETTALGNWASATLPQVLGDPVALEPIAARIADKLLPAAEAVIAACDAAPARLNPRAKRNRRYAELLVRGIADGQVTPLRRLLALEVVGLALGGPPTVDQRVDLIQVSGDAGNGLDPREQAEDKLAGIQFARFGAFYKRSWRANDWMWGRHDAAQRIAQLLLEPARLRQLGLSVADAIASVERIAFGGDLSSEDNKTLRQATPRPWDVAVAETELSFLDNSGEAAPATIPMCAQAVARRLQLDILVEELPRVREAIELDEKDGALVSEAASAFCEVYDTATQPLTAAAAIELFALCRVGQEKFAAEAGSYLRARTSTRTLAVAATALSGEGSGLPKPLRLVLRPLRSVAMTKYYRTLARWRATAAAGRLRRRSTAAGDRLRRLPAAAAGGLRRLRAAARSRLRRLRP